MATRFQPSRGLDFFITNIMNRKKTKRPAGTRSSLNQIERHIVAAATWVGLMAKIEIAAKLKPGYLIMSDFEAVMTSCSPDGGRGRRTPAGTAAAWAKWLKDVSEVPESVLRRKLATAFGG